MWQTCVLVASLGAPLYEPLANVDQLPRIDLARNAHLWILTALSDQSRHPPLSQGGGCHHMVPFGQGNPRRWGGYRV